jgi:anti-anti-sigma regulatory factor
MNELIKLNYRNEIYENVNVKFIDIKTIQVKEIPLAIGIRYNDILEVEQIEGIYFYKRKIKISNCKRTRILIPGYFPQSNEFKKFIQYIEDNDGMSERVMGGFLTLEIPKELNINVINEIEKIERLIANNPIYQIQSNFKESFLSIIENSYENKIEKENFTFKEYEVVKISGDLGIYHSIFNSIYDLVILYSIKNLILDISELNNMNSNYIGLFVNIKKFIEIELKGSFQIFVGKNDLVSNFFTLTKLDNFFTINTEWEK